MEKLKDLMGTKYITDDHVTKLNKLLEEVDVIDLFHCRFTPGANRVLQKYYATVDIHNTENATLEWILQHNCQAKRGGFKTFPKEQLKTNWNSKEEVFTYLETLKTNTIYVLEDSKSNSIAIAIMILLKFPRIFIDLGPVIFNVFEQVRIDWLQNKRSHNEYWLLRGMAVKRLKKDESDMFVLLDGSITNEKLLVRTYMVIPSDFGVKELYDTNEFEEVWSNATKNLTYISNNGRCMKDYLIS